MRTILILLFASLISACSPTQSKADYTLTYASPYPPTHPFSRADIDWMNYIRSASHGRIEFRAFWSGSLISSDLSMVEIRHGLADIGLITPIYALGGAQMLRAQSGFYGGVKSINDQVAIYDCLASHFPELDGELHGLHVLAVQGGNFPGVLTRTRPVHTLADLKGLRLRAPNETMEVLRDLGVDPVNMPMDQVYSALAKGVIDGVVAPADTLKSLHFAEVAHHFTKLRFSRGAYPARAMSDRAWDRLPPDLQNLLIRSKPVWEASLNKELLSAEQAGLSYGKDHGVEIIDVSEADQSEFDALYNRFALDQAKRLSAYNLKGVPVFKEAQSLIAGSKISCPHRDQENKGE